MDLSRTIIIGNSGSGKSWLAERIAARLHAPWVDLDLLHWEPGGFNVSRGREDAIARVKAASVGDCWVIEGIYGQLVQEGVASATALVWLDVAESECVANIERRGLRRGGTKEAFVALLQWAGTYRARSGSSSYSAHERIFDDFRGEKVRLSSRDDATAFVHRAFP